MLQQANSIRRQQLSLSGDRLGPLEKLWMGCGRRPDARRLWFA